MHFAWIGVHTLIIMYRKHTSYICRIHTSYTVSALSRFCSTLSQFLICWFHHVRNLPKLCPRLALSVGSAPTYHPFTYGTWFKMGCTFVWRLPPPLQELPKHCFYLATTLFFLENVQAMVTRIHYVHWRRNVWNSMSEWLRECRTLRGTYNQWSSIVGKYLKLH